MRRAIIATGGTGGHIFPALAAAKALAELHPDIEIVFVGGSGPEGELARRAGLRFLGLPAQGVFGRGARGVLAGLWSARGLFLALRFLRSFKPDAAIGFGGYAGFFPILAARLAGIPTAIHEQNSVPGVSNKLLGRMVDRVFLTYADDARVFPESRSIRVGNPVREEIAALWEGATREGEARNVLVLGGSQGAKAVNQAMIEALPALLGSGVRATLQTGRADFQRCVEAVESLADRGIEPESGEEDRQPRMVVENFIEDMASAYAWADLVVARAGASTLAEITAAGKPSILIPFPFATHDHQLVNARVMDEAGAAVLVEQKTLAKTDLAGLILELLHDPERLSKMGRTARSLAAPKAALRIAEELTALVEAKQSRGRSE